MANAYRIDLKKNCTKSAMLITNSFDATLNDNIVQQEYQNSVKYGISSSVRTISAQRNRRVYLTSLVDKLALDFYASEESTVYYKNHPHSSEVIKKLPEYYGDYCHAFTDMPFQFLSRYMKAKGIKFRKIICYYSTSKEAIDDKITDKSYTLGHSYVQTWFYYLQLYAVLAFLNENKTMFEHIYAVPHLAEQFNFLAESQGIAIHVDTFTNLKSKPPVSLYIGDSNSFNGLLNEEQLLKLQHVSVFLLNMDNGKSFFSENLLPNLTALTIHKTPISDEVEYPCHDETAWFISKNIEFSDAVRKFKMTKILPKTGITLEVKRRTFADNVSKFEHGEQRIFRYKVAQYDKKLSNLTNFNRALFELPKLDTVIEIAKATTDFELYIDLLSIIQRDYLIVFAICDTPGNNISAEAISKIHQLCFSKFDKTLWKMFVGAIYQNKLFAHLTDEPKKDISYTATDPVKGFELMAESGAWSRIGGSNKAVIEINGTDYAVNMRGVNIVIYNTEKKELIDSVAFDWHDTACVCKRLNAK